MRILFVILDILKNILLFIFYVLIALIALLLLVLFFPIKYNIKLSYDGELEANVKASWLFKLVRFEYRLGEGDTVNSLKILWFTLLPKKKKNTEETHADISNTKPGEKNENTKARGKETVGSHKSCDVNEDEENGILQRISSYVDKISGFLSYPNKDEITRLTITLLKKLFKIFKTQTATLEGEIGFDDPADTGLFLGGIAIISAWLPQQYKTDIVGNFEKKMLRLNVAIKGNLILWYLLFPITIYILSEPIWNIIKKKNSK